MRGSVFTYQSGAVKTDDNGQIQNGHVMDNIVVGTLCKSAIDIAEGLQPVFCHSAGERHSMAFGNTYVEGALRHFLHHDVHGTSGRHGRRDPYDTWILLSQFQQRLTEHLLELGGLVVTLFTDTLTGIHIKLTRCMPDSSLILGRFVAMSFLRVQMEHLRAFHVLQLSEQSNQFLHIVSVERSEVTDVHALKDVLLMRDGALQGIAETDESLTPVFFQIALAVEPS